MSSHDEYITDRDRELALKALQILALSEPTDQIDNIALVFALARSEERSEIIKKLSAE